jgi:hypothetical protein
LIAHSLQRPGLDGLRLGLNRGLDDDALDHCPQAYRGRVICASQGLCILPVDPVCQLAAGKRSPPSRRLDGLLVARLGEAEQRLSDAAQSFVVLAACSDLHAECIAERLVALLTARLEVTLWHLSLAGRPPLQPNHLATLLH